MSEIWLRDYIFLAFQLHRALSTAYGSPFVEDYWRPLTLQKQAETEPEATPGDLVRHAMALSDALAAQGVYAIPRDLSGRTGESNGNPCAQAVRGDLCLG